MTSPLILNETAARTAPYTTSPTYGAISGDTTNSRGDSITSSSSSTLLHQTNVVETFVHLIKGYIGPGCLSLPWAVSQLGVGPGFFMVLLMAYWSSYNCWTVVRLKRFVEKRTEEDDENAEMTDDEQHSETSSNVTYPEVGSYLFGRTFESCITICICVQQLAVCTVFFSFVGENLMAVLRNSLSTDSMLHILNTHVGVITVFLPVVLALAFIPSLKHLAPVIATAIATLVIGFAVLGLLVAMEWEHRPALSPPEDLLSSVPLAMCAILYSFEGICLILPVESAMKEPQKFERVFWSSMAVVGLIMASFGAICVTAFGKVTNGSITAFLINDYETDETEMGWIMIANTAVSLSVLLTYPLQIFPTFELVGPAARRFWLHITGRDQVLSDEEDEKDLAGFEPLPCLPEHDVPSVDSMPEKHLYEEQQDEYATTESDLEDDDLFVPPVLTGSVFSTTIRGMTATGDSLQIRAALVLLTYTIAVLIPNVQALISLAGALAGSSVALLFPPLLELGWIRYMEDTAGEQGHKLAKHRDYKFARIKSWVLLLLGTLFCVVGTWASIKDIVSIYRTGRR